MRVLLNVIWFLLSGLWMAIGYAIAGVIMFVLIITIPIIGLPLAAGNVKMIPIALWPFGREIVPVEAAEAIYAIRA